MEPYAQKRCGPGKMLGPHRFLFFGQFEDGRENTTSTAGKYANNSDKTGKSRQISDKILEEQKRELENPLEFSEEIR